MRSLRAIGRMGCALLSMMTLAAGSSLPRTVDEGIGVAVHFSETGPSAAELDRIAAAGFRVVRTDLFWDGVETKRGVYDWSFYDKVAAELRKRNIRPLFILDYSNELYAAPVTFTDEGEKLTRIRPPTQASAVAAYARWAAAAAARYAPYDPLWEIWNEPDVPLFWPPRPNPKEYVPLVVAACRAIKQQQPNATILAPALSEIPRELSFVRRRFKLGFLRDVLMSAAGRSLTGISIHPYRDREPETLLADMPALQKIAQAAAPENTETPRFVISEWGYSTAPKARTDDMQAAWLIRQQLVAQLAGIPLAVWYVWRDEGTDPDEKGHHFGVVTYDGKDKPALKAVTTLAAQLKGYRFLARKKSSDAQTFLLIFGNDTGARKLVAWNSHGTARTEIPAAEVKPGGRVMDVLGRVQSVGVKNGSVVLELGPYPLYIELR